MQCRCLFPISILPQIASLEILFIYLIMFHQPLPMLLISRSGLMKTPFFQMLYRCYVMYGWPSINLGSQFASYKSRERELSILDGCVVWGA